MSDQSLLNRQRSDDVRMANSRKSHTKALDTEQKAFIDRWLPRFKEDYEKKGNSLALFNAIGMCARFGYVVPKWASEAFDHGLGKVALAEVGSWDAAFSRPYPKGTHLAKLRRRQEVDLLIYSRIREVLAWRPGEPSIANWLTRRASIDPELFEEVGKEFHVGARLCKDLYYQQKKILDPYSS